MAKEIKITRLQRQAMVSELEAAQKQLVDATEARERARAEGDLAENSPFEAANRECERLGKLILELNQTLDSASVAENIDTSKVGQLTKVTLRVTNKATQVAETKVYVMVSSGQGKLPNFVSIDSKLGAAIVDKHVGDVIQFQDNAFNSKVLEILAIEEAD